ncbi:tetratricopeptide repeat protein [Candidatus Parcubacteria bacterium]|nr:tetratricopeptide repeat protein [Candidatus Parcubacteria bacterium]
MDPKSFTHIKGFKKPLLGVAVVLALALIVAGLLYWRVSLGRQVQASINRSIGLNVNGNYDMSLAVLNSAYPKALSKAEKRDVLLALAATYSNKGGHEQAFGQYQKIEQLIGPSHGTAEGMGRAAEAMGNKQLAIEHYKRAIPLLQSSNSLMIEDETRDLKTSIERLGGRP